MTLSIRYNIIKSVISEVTCFTRKPKIQYQLFFNTYLISHIKSQCLIISDKSQVWKKTHSQNKNPRNLNCYNWSLEEPRGERNPKSDERIHYYKLFHEYGMITLESSSSSLSFSYSSMVVEQRDIFQRDERDQLSLIQIL